jgi:hypothetical protein
MARARINGNGRLEEAMATLLQNQAILVQTQAAFVAQKAETDRHMADTDRQMAEIKHELTELKKSNAERFARIEAILLEHNRILAALPDQLREKIGFKTAEKA